MRLVARRAAANARSDALDVHREDGSVASIPLPRQGILPHDLVHAVVESMLPLRGYLGAIDAGAELAFTMQAPSPEHAASLARVEAVVEALQSQLWAGALDAAAFDAGLRGACAQRAVDPPQLDAAMLARLYDAAQALDARWQAVPPYGALELDFVPAG
ncbi:hypothetical protein [Lysobacter humi (ex Lee et al. 2017)]